MNTRTQPAIHSNISPAWSDMSDAQLIARIAAKGLGWRKAGNVLLQRHHTWILNRCYKYLGNRHDAEDVTQEATIRAIRGLSTFEGRSSLRAWLGTIADNQCASYLSRNRRYVHSDHLETLIELRGDSSAEQSPQSELESDQVRSILNLLPQQAKRVLLLRFYEDLSLEEIALRLKISLSAAKMRLYRAIEQFKLRYLQLTHEVPA